jgi:AcrR family transcriptional regulator
MSDRDGEAPGILGIADQRREQMLRAALAVITERGYPDTRIADVAERTGISPALVIYYFKTKAQLLVEAIRYAEDSWYTNCQRRLAELPSASARLEELVAMQCLTEHDPEPQETWPLWLDFWAQAARNPDVASLRQKTDERWRETIRSLVIAGQETGEFNQVDPYTFAIMLCSLMDGLAIQIALEDSVIQPEWAFEMSMRFVVDQLGLERSQAASVRPPPEAATSE